MGAAKRRGTFDQRKDQRLSKQYRLANAELASAYSMNRRYDLYKRAELRTSQQSEPLSILKQIFNSL